MRFAQYLVSALLVGAFSVSASALNLRGTDAVKQVADQVLASCPAASGLTHVGGGSHLGEQALSSGQQEIAFMSRELDPFVTCASPAPEQAEGLVIALDAVLVGTDAATALQCSGELSSSGMTLVTEQNGIPGLQCPDCSPSNVYVLADWRDALRVLLAGMSHNAGADLNQQDCNSDVRHALANDRSLLFAGGCGDPDAPLAALRHVFRTSNRSPSVERLRQVLGLPETGAVFCNGGSYRDLDPIRRACDPSEQVCRYDGTLGLVLPIAVPTLVPGASPNSGNPTNAAEAVNPNLCSEGVFKYRSTLDDETGAPLIRCANNSVSVFGNCLTPQDSNHNFGCINGADNCPFGTPLSTSDCRGYTAEARKLNGTPLVDTLEAGEVMGAYYRLHTTTPRVALANTCQHADSSAALGCLLQASGVGIGLGGRNLDTEPAAVALSIEGVAPTDSDIRAILSNPESAYPFATKVTLQSMRGSEEIMEPRQDAAWACFRQNSLVAPAVAAAGFVSLGQPPVCDDFDDRSCGNLFNRNNCIKGGINMCPSITSFVVSPLQVSVGGSINVSISGTDADNHPIEYAWTASAGELAEPFAASTTYTCTVAGSQTIVGHLWDGRCETVRQAVVNCVAGP